MFNRSYPSVVGVPALIVLAGLLPGCVPPPPPEPIPLVVWPGQNKPYAIFQQDDANCRAATGQPAIAAGGSAADGAVAAVVPIDPNVAYTQCMVAHGNIAAPAPTAPPPVAYGYPYPVYYGGPVVYGDPFFYHGWGWRGGFGYGGGYYHRWR